MTSCQAITTSPAVFWKTFLRCLAALLILLSFSFPAKAQVWIKGYLKDEASHRAIANGEVRSSFSNALTDSNGFFRIKANEGDIISAKKFGYRFDTIHFSFGKIDSTLTLYLEPLGRVMQNVTVRTSYSAYQVDSMRRREAFDEGLSKTTLISKQPHEGFGLVFNIDRLTKSKDRHREKQKEIFEKTEQWAYVRYRFSDSIVQFYTGLKGDSLHVFVNRYMPSYEWLRANPSKTDLVFYINEKMKLFRKENFQ